MDDIKRLQQYIDESQKIVFFGGAGVSTESGVPDFRSKDGLYNQHDIQFEQYSPEYLLSHECLVEHPDVFFEFYRQKMDARHVLPNITHKKLAELEAAGKLKAVITQNIDGLHQAAGSKVVYELHGSIHRNYCQRCMEFYDAAYVKNSSGIPKCSKCGGTIKPDVVLYEEGLDSRIIHNSIRAISEADTLIIGGTSLVVYPAAGFIDYFQGKHLVVINKSATAKAVGAEIKISAPTIEII